MARDGDAHGQQCGDKMSCLCEWIVIGRVRTHVVDAMFYYIISFVADHEISAMDS